MTEPKPIRFELDRLVSYDEASLIEELKRVAALVPEPKLTRAAFDRHARVTSSTILRRLGGWSAALERSGLGHRYSGRTVSQNMRDQLTRSMTDDQLLAELRRVADELGTDTLTRELFRRHANGVNDAGVARRFGSWSVALRKAGLTLAAHGRRWTEDDYFENLLSVWTHYGRAPTYAEMNLPPSRITNGAYANRFGTWGLAKLAFVKRVNSDLGSEVLNPRPSDSAEAGHAARPTSAPKAEDRGSIPLGLRYKVLSRDRFRCSICGRSPANELAVRLHVDHFVPLAAGGKTREDNLRSLCADCNLGKGSKLEARDNSRLPISGRPTGSN
jgi:hypothetical protein